MENTNDKMLYTLAINLFTLGKDEKELNIFNFNKKDSRHWALIHAASSVRDITGFSVKLNVSFFTYLWAKWKFKNIKGIKRTKKANVDAEDVVAHVEKAYEVDRGFSKIYKEYYRNSDRG